MAAPLTAAKQIAVVPSSPLTLLNPTGKHIWRQPAQPIKKLHETPWQCSCNNCTIHEQLHQRLHIAICLFAQLQKTAHLPASSACKPKQIALPVGSQQHLTKNIQHCCDIATNSCTKFFAFPCSGCIHMLTRYRSCWHYCWCCYCCD